MSLKAKIEAVLFLTSKPIKAQAIARIVNADVQQVRQALLELVHDYEERKGGLEIADEDGYSFQVRDEYSSMMDEFLPVEMSAALIRTLSAIAIKQPVMQSEIIRVRGAGAYDHIKELVAKELIAKKEEDGSRSPTLSTTKKFQEYFKLSKDGKDLRNYLKKQVKKAEEVAAAAAAGADQLVIADVVTAKTDEFINSGIYLETADGGADDAAEMAAEVAAVVADEAIGPIVGAARDERSEASPALADDALVVDATPPAVEVLSKLADVAAEAHEPIATEEEITATDLPQGSSVQANNQKRKEPKTAATPKKQPAAKEPPSLIDLLVKQKQLEKQLKIGFDQIGDEPVVPPSKINSDTNQLAE